MRSVLVVLTYVSVTISATRVANIISSIRRRLAFFRRVKGNSWAQEKECSQHWERDEFESEHSARPQLDDTEYRKNMAQLLILMPGS